MNETATIFKCETCDREFTSKNALSGHLTAHNPRRTGAIPVACPECGKEFATTNALGAHRYRVHGTRGGGSNGHNGRIAEPLSVITAQVQSTLGDLVAPLRAQKDEVDARLSELHAETVELRETGRQIDAVLARLTGETTAKKAPTSAVGSQMAYEKKLAIVREYINSHAADFAYGFSVNELTRRLSQNGYKGKISWDVTNRAVRELHALGILRADKARKRGMTYKVVGT